MVVTTAISSEHQSAIGGAGRIPRQPAPAADRPRNPKTQLPEAVVPFASGKANNLASDLKTSAVWTRPNGATGEDRNHRTRRARRRVYSGGQFATDRQRMGGEGCGGAGGGALVAVARAQQSDDWAAVRRSRSSLMPSLFAYEPLSRICALHRPSRQWANIGRFETALSAATPPDGLPAASVLNPLDAASVHCNTTAHSSHSNTRTSV